MKELFIKDFFSYFKSKLAYVILFIYAITSFASCFYMGGFFDVASNNLSAFFYFQPNIFSFIIPVISLKLWSEERRSNTFELLLSQPLDYKSIVVAKFFSCFSFGLVMLFLTIPFLIFASFYINLDYLSILSSYIAVLFSICTISAVCCLVSSFFASSAVCYIFSLFAVWLLFFAGFSNNYTSIIYGQIGIDNIIYFLAITYFAIRININWLQNKFVIKKTFVYSAILQLFSLVILVVASSLLFSSHRFDISHSKAFSLSKSAKEVLQSYKPQTLIELYTSDFSKTNKKQEEYIKNVARFIKQIPNKSLLIKNIKPFSKEEDEAISFDLDFIEGQNYNLYSGIVLSANGSRSVINSINPQDANYLEKDIIRAIDSINASPKTIGIISGDAGIIKKNYGIAQGGDWPFIKDLKKYYKIISLPPKIAQIPKEVDILLIIKQPKSVLLKYAIDQYLMRGGKVLIIENNINFAYKNKISSQGKTDVYASEFVSEFQENIVKDPKYAKKMLPHFSLSINEPMLIVINENIIGNKDDISKQDLQFLLTNFDYLSNNQKLLEITPKKDIIELESIKNKTENKISSQYIKEVDEINKSVSALKDQILAKNINNDSSIDDFKQTELLQQQIVSYQNQAKEIAYLIEEKTKEKILLYIIINMFVFPICYIFILAVLFKIFRKNYVKI